MGGGGGVRRAMSSPPAPNAAIPMSSVGETSGACSSPSRRSWDEPMRHAARLMLLRSSDLRTWHEVGAFGPESMLGELLETPLLRRMPVKGEAMEDRS